MSKKIYFKGREQRKDGLSNFTYFIEEDKKDQSGVEITVIVDRQWYDEELMRIGKLDIPDSTAIGVLIRYIAQEAAAQYDQFSSSENESVSRTIPPDRAVDFNEIMNIARGEQPKVILPENFSDHFRS